MNCLILVNRHHTWQADIVQDLVPVYRDYPTILMEREAAQGPDPEDDDLPPWD